MLEILCILALLLLELLVVISVAAYLIQRSEERTYNTIETLRARVNELIEIMKGDEDAD